MTNPSDPLLTDPTLELTDRTSYLNALPLREDTLARATDINEIQQRVDDALKLFGADVDGVLRNMLLAMVYRIMALERRQAQFEAAIRSEFAAYRAEIDAALAELRAYLDQQIQEMTAFVLAKVGEMKAYADDQDTKTLAAAKTYVDEREKFLLELMWANAMTGMAFSTPIIGDGGNYFGGKRWDFIAFNVPEGMSFHVYGWQFAWVTTADSGGAADALQVFWPEFMGQRAYNDGGNHSEAMNGGTTPLFGIQGPYFGKVGIYINNLKGYAVFTVRGRLVPASLQAVAVQKQWAIPTTWVSGGPQGADPAAPIQGGQPTGTDWSGGYYNVSFANLIKGPLHNQDGWATTAAATSDITINGLELYAPHSSGSYVGAVHDMPNQATSARIQITAGNPVLQINTATSGVYYAAYYTAATTLKIGVFKEGVVQTSSEGSVTVSGSGVMNVELEVDSANKKLRLYAWRDSDTRPAVPSVVMDDTSGAVRPFTVGLIGVGTVTRLRLG